MLVNLNEVLKDAQKNNYAVGLFNATDTDMLQGIIEAAEELRSPVILGTAEVLLPYADLELMAPAYINMAKNASVPVVVHFDHGLTLDRCVQALRLGFSSIMFDGSAKPYEQNIKETQEIVRLAHSFGASVEGEIGHVGLAASAGDESPYTTVQEAKDYMAGTGVDALAIAIGTAHGKYLKKPVLDIDRLREIRAAIDTPLVLHGGSGLSDDDFRNCVKNGISKVNIFTDILTAGEVALKEAFKAEMGYLDARNVKMAVIKEAVKNKLRLFGSENKA